MSEYTVLTQLTTLLSTMVAGYDEISAVNLVEGILDRLMEETMVQRGETRPLPANITSVQPGGGFCYRLELLWGRMRRCWLKAVRRGYLQRMAERRVGSTDGAAFEILDPRDLKYARNQCTCDWPAEDDPFRWRDKIPLARWGLAETVIMSTPLVVCTALPTLLWPDFWWTGIAPLILFGWVLYFFRDPPRCTPRREGILVAPADGTIAEVTKVDHDDFIDGPAVRVGVFLSIFNVHINRAPSDARVVELRYSPGMFLNALNPESAIKNENMWIALEEEHPPYRQIVVRQIAGLIARRIVCNLRPGESLKAGQQFGMIKLGSRTELIVPDKPGLSIGVTVGQKIKAGVTVVAQYNEPASE
ncbi:MAG: phosphatidylserine decarboxylase [Planctomycetota bacterium]|nr:phosphatidylserine decarboxylase [Planctomycetota bacterium]